ncbi:Uncharacterised protein [Vibrio cholerae]|nr:Uncharacterised protein [Vibrio cholerae]
MVSGVNKLLKTSILILRILHLATWFTISTSKAISPVIALALNSPPAMPMNTCIFFRVVRI